MARKSAIFRPGDAVVCINTDFRENPYPDITLIETPKGGTIYTVREITRVEKGGYGIRLDQIKNRPIPLNGKDHIIEPCFNEKRFRKASIIPDVAI